MRPGTLVLAVLTAATILAGPASLVEAQRGRGRAAPPPSPLAPPGEYSLEFEQVLEAINRGEGRRALAYYEGVAAQAEQQGDRRRAGQAGLAIAYVTVRLGLYQKTIQAAAHAIELLKPVTPASPAILALIASNYSQMGGAYRKVGDLAQARKVFEAGLAYVEPQRGRREMDLAAGFATGYLGASLAVVALAQGDYQEALARASRAAQFFEDVSLPPGARPSLRWNKHRQAAQSSLVVGRAQLALGHAPEAEAAFVRALQSARLVGLRELQVEILQAQGNLALLRQDWSKALSLQQQGLALAQQIGRSVALMWLNYDQP